MRRLMNIATQQASQAIQQSVLYQSNHQLFTLTFNRPKALNSVNNQMIKSITSKLHEIDQHQVLWMQGAGNRAFCAGGDIKAYLDKNVTNQDKINWCRDENTIYHRIHQLKSVQISSWDGVAMGSGVGLSIFGSFTVATERTVFAMPEAKIGFFADAGATYALSRLRNNIGFYLGLTSQFLRGEQVFIAGLANFYIPSDKLKEAYQEITEVFSKKVENPKEIVAQILKKYHSPSGKSEIQDEAKIKELFSLGSGKEIFEKATSIDDDFHKKVVKALSSVCPLSVELIYRILHMTKTMSVKECLERDNYLSQNIVNGHDYNEGVRCLLIDKGQIPKWSHPDIKSVTKEEIDRLLVPAQGYKPIF